MLFYRSKHTEIHYHEKEKLVEAVWRGFAPSTDYRASMNSYIEGIKAHEVERRRGLPRRLRIGNERADHGFHPPCR
jgi:hypothetical protein